MYLMVEEISNHVVHYVQLSDEIKLLIYNTIYGGDSICFIPLIKDEHGRDVTTLLNLLDVTICTAKFNGNLYTTYSITDPSLGIRSICLKGDKMCLYSMLGHLDKIHPVQKILIACMKKRVFLDEFEEWYYSKFVEKGDELKEFFKSLDR